VSNRILSTVVLIVFLFSIFGSACSPQKEETDSSALMSGADMNSDPPQMAFVPNQGQFDPAILFRTLGSSSTLLFAHHEVMLPFPVSHPSAGLFTERMKSGQKEAAVSADPAVLRLRFENANPQVDVLGEDRLVGVVNYFIGKDPQSWHAAVPTYGRIIYKQIYPGIDLLYQSSEGSLKGTYLIAAGVDPSLIRWRYQGAASVELVDGDLQISIAGGDAISSLVERAPQAWQTRDGERVPVSARYVIYNDNSIGFELGKYDVTLPLTIDPTLDYATYWGESACYGAYHMALDADDAVYLVGPTNFQSPTPSDCDSHETFDIFVTKLDPSQSGANQHIYTTYIGGSDFDSSSGIAVDSNKRVYLAGFSSSDDFPTTLANAYQTEYHDGGADGVAVQLNAAGAVQYATYLGGAGFDELFSVAFDGGYMYLSGAASSTDFPKTPDALQGARGSGDEYNSDAVVAVMDLSKSGKDSLVYATYYGGDEYDESWAVDAVNGVIYFAGNTLSDGLLLKNPTQATFGGGSGWGDAYLVKLDPSKTGAAQLSFATYLGGSDDEASGGISVDANGNVYWVGISESTNFPTTPVSPAHAGGKWDAFIVKLDTATPKVVYSRLLGGSGDDGFKSVTFDSAGNAFAAGGTGSSDLTMLNPIQNTQQGGTATWSWFSWFGPVDGLVAAFDPQGALTFSTYLGGNISEVFLGIAIDSTGQVYVAGGTESTDMQTVNALQDAKAGTCDTFVARIGGLSTPPEPAKIKLYLPIVLNNK
jgi:hypothetical protein